MKVNTKIYKGLTLFDIDLSFFNDKGKDTLFLDLDNTLDIFSSKKPSVKTIELVKKIKQNGIKVVIVSNNNKKRVEEYAKMIEVEYVYRCFKPFTAKINSFIEKNELKKDKIILIGDQFMTDIKCANSLGVDSIYTDELEHKNALISYFNKTLEKFVVKKYKKYFLEVEDKYVITKKS